MRIAEVEREIFYSKVYLMPYDDSLATFVGWANLTRGGIQSNEEADAAGVTEVTVRHRYRELMAQLDAAPK